MIHRKSILLLLLACFLNTTNANTIDQCDNLVRQKLTSLALPVVFAGYPEYAIDAEKAISACTDALTDGRNDARVMLQLAWGYLQAGDYDSAMTWAQKSANLGNHDAMTFLAILYFNDDSFDDKIANKLFLNAIEQGNVYAKGYAYRLFELGKLQSIDFEIIERWTKEAAESNVALAQFNYAMMVAQDENEHVAWMQKASENGYLVAMEMMSGYYASGFVVSKDTEKAKTLRLRMGDMGNAQIKYNLANAYLFGDNVIERNKGQEIYWLTQVVNSPFPDRYSETVLDSMLRLMNYYLDDETVEDCDQLDSWKTEAGRLFSQLSDADKKVYESRLKRLDRAVGEKCAINMHN